MLRFWALRERLLSRAERCRAAGREAASAKLQDEMERLAAQYEDLSKSAERLARTEPRYP